MTGSQLSMRRIVEGVRGGEWRAVDLARQALERVQRLDPRLGTHLVTTDRLALARAEAVDARVAAGEDPGPLAGVPVSIKDNLCLRGAPTTCGSRMLASYEPPYDATAVARLLAAGAVPVGKTNLDEFAMGSSNENSARGPVRNPWDETRVPGGSSGGSAAAVAAGFCAGALGSDTGGSIRQPAAFCGVLGLKPTYGRVSRYGLVAFASSLDQVGPFARDARDLELLYRVISGHDPRDSTSVPREVDAVDWSAGVRGLRIGLAEACLDREGVDPEVADRVRETAAALAERGATVQPVTLPEPDRALGAYYLLCTAEASSNLARYDGVRYGLRVPGDSLEDMIRRTRTEGFGDEVKRRILLGTYVLSAGYFEAYYLRAQRTRARLREAFAALHRDFDLILLPTTPTPPFVLGEKAADPLAMYLADLFTVYANLTGAPALSVPAGRTPGGLPLGVQFMAAPWREDLLFRVAEAVGDLPGWGVEIAPVAPGDVA